MVVTSGKELLDELTPSMSGRGLELVCVPTLKYAAARLQTGDCTAMAVDFTKIPPAEREAFLALHEQYPQVHMFTLESNASMTPTLSSPIRRLTWPLPPGFGDQVRVIARSVAMLADQVLFTTGAVQTAFRQSGVQPASLESTKGLPEFIREQMPRT